MRPRIQTEDWRDFRDDKPVFDWNLVAPPKHWREPEQPTRRDMLKAAVVGVLIFLAGVVMWILGILYFG